MGLFSGNKKQTPKVKEKNSTLYGALHTGAIVGIFATVGLGFLFAMNTLIPQSANMLGFIGTLFALSSGLFSVLYWVRLFEKKQFVKVSIVFMALTALSVLLWIICLWRGISVYNQIKSLSKANSVEGAVDTAKKSVKSLMSTLNFIKVVAVFSVQFMVASFVATNITKFRTKMIVFQAISYISYLVLDFFITYYLSCIHINASKIEFSLSDSLHLLTSKPGWVLFGLSLLYVSLSGAVLKAISKRRLENRMLDEMEKEGDPLGVSHKESADSANEGESTADRLAKIKNLLDQGLITQEEYDQKRNDILESV